jgi:hypothetical protein
MKRIEFTLSMPSVNTWNNRWSGEGQHYAIVRTLTDKLVMKLLNANSEGYWHHNFGDGWAAGISARIMKTRERVKKSSGFCGYDWMVRDIIDHGYIGDPRQIAVSKTADSTNIIYDE